MDRHYKVFICYNGSSFAGWQRQLSGLAIQEILEKALAILLKKETPLTGASRTDQGVHAKGQVAHFKAPLILDIPRFCYKWNALIPHDIRICHLEETDPAFHARFCATGKHYTYNISTKNFIPPFKRADHLHCHYPLDLELMKKAASLFVGKHDFYSFTSQPDSFPSTFNFKRTIFDISIEEGDGTLHLHYRGDGFLRKMIRNITGAILEAGRKKTSLEEIKRLLSTRDKTRVPICAPAHGLILVEVFYGNS